MQVHDRSYVDLGGDVAVTTQGRATPYKPPSVEAEPVPRTNPAERRRTGDGAWLRSTTVALARQPSSYGELAQAVEAG